MTWQAPREVKQAEEGVRRAVGRLRADLAVSGGSPYFSLFEVLGWLYGLEEWHEKDLGEAIYREKRKNSPDGEVLGALMWARNSGVHDLATHTRLAHVYPSPTLAPGEDLVLGEMWRWLPREDLQIPQKYKPHGRDDWYSNHVGQRPVMPPTDKASRFLLMEIYRHH